MADLPILFSAPMVRALIAGTKTQTRRVVKPQPFSDGYYQGEIDCVAADDGRGGGQYFRFGVTAVGGGAIRTEIYAPRIAVGDRLWVREGLSVTDNDQGFRWLSYAADGADVLPLQQWFKERNSVPSIHMPRRASRLTLTVTDVRVQRLQDISEDDAIAEGALVHPASGFVATSQIDFDRGPFFNNARQWYADIWDSINGGGAWDANPWIATYSFRVERRNIDAPATAEVPA